MIKTVKISDFFENFSVTFAVDFDVFMKHMDFSREDMCVNYLARLAEFILGHTMADNLNVYGASLVARESGADCYTRGEHGVVLVNVEYVELDTVEYSALEKLPAPPKESDY